ncbi:MAG: FAD-binding oxidoreductase [Desulfosoma sp.]|uniref:FAD-binding oxidoreductase n=1 Tax=Desulfosoma sp. TaxID=2603217 RepID=UPI004049B7F5
MQLLKNHPPRRLTSEALAALRHVLGQDLVSTDPEKLAQCSQDASHTPGYPEAVVTARSEQDVVRLMELADRYRFPVTPRGMGTGLAGGASPVCGGVVLNLSAMNHIVTIDARNLLAEVEPGVVTAELKRAAKAHGLYYPPDPASIETCSIGGNAATNAGGPSCVKYGVTRDYVLGLHVVLPNGSLIRTGVRTRKGVVGYDLTRLIVGSEGTLGVITRLILRLIPHPPAVTTLVALFSDMTQAMNAVSGILTSGLVPSALEFLDRRCLELVGDLLPFQEAHDAGSFLLVEADGYPQVIVREIERMGEVCLEHGAREVLMAPDAAKREKMWAVRREVSLRIEHSAAVYVPEDVVVPLGEIAGFIRCIPEMERRFDLRIYCFGHAGDGNIHLNITASRECRPERVEEGVRALLAEVLKRGGTISGEHGVGVAKQPYLALEQDSELIRLQMALKKVFDPNLILNPGKIFPWNHASWRV